MQHPACRAAEPAYPLPERVSQRCGHRELVEQEAGWVGQRREAVGRTASADGDPLPFPQQPERLLHHQRDTHRAIPQVRGEVGRHLGVVDGPHQLSHLRRVERW